MTGNTGASGVEAPGGVEEVWVEFQQSDPASGLLGFWAEQGGGGGLGERPEHRAVGGREPVD